MPYALVTAILPLAPPDRVAVIVLSSTTVNDAALTPPKLTAVAPVKLPPLMVITPVVAATGLNEVMYGER